jgi:hypothetical protein
MLHILMNPHILLHISEGFVYVHILHDYTTKNASASHEYEPLMEV